MKTPLILLKLVALVWLLAPASAGAFYNPQAGRWLNRDPIGERGGVNLHVFVGNEAVGHVDLHGLEVLCYYAQGGEWSCRSPMEGCCNGQTYLYATHCCCKGKVVAKDPVESGIQVWKWVDSVPNPRNPGAAPDMHTWLTWDAAGGGTGSVDANALIDSGFVASPAAGPSFYFIPAPTSSAVRLSKCDYDFKCMRRCLDREAAQWAARGRYSRGNCQDFVLMLLATCKNECKGCTDD
jgi:hypothetical protein